MENKEILLWCKEWTEAKSDMGVDYAYRITGGNLKNDVEFKIISKIPREYYGLVLKDIRASYERYILPILLR